MEHSEEKIVYLLLKMILQNEDKFLFHNFLTSFAFIRFFITGDAKVPAKMFRKWR
jgi:hypothetical protein